MSWVLAKDQTAACLQCNPVFNNRVSLLKNAYTDTSEKKKNMEANRNWFLMRLKLAVPSSPLTHDTRY